MYVYVFLIVNEKLNSYPFFIFYFVQAKRELIDQEIALIGAFAGNVHDSAF